VHKTTATPAPVDDYQERRRSRYSRHRLYPFLMVLPAMATLMLVNIYPTLYTLSMSFFVQKPGLRRFVAFGNYVNIASDTNFWNALRVTFSFVVLAVAVELVFGFGVALLLNRTFRGRGLIRSLLILPMAMTPIAAALGWRIMYNSIYGVINYALSLVGIPPQSWLGDAHLALVSVVMIDVWQCTPLVTLMVLAGLQSLPISAFEAARMDGANGAQMLRFITIPLMKPILIIAVLVRAIDAFKTFDIIYATTEGGPGSATLTMNIMTFLTGLRFGNIGYAAALCMIMLIISLILTNYIGRSLKIGA